MAKGMDLMALHEECGIFGIYDKNGSCAENVYYGLYALQHRGQESCGIATINDRELSFYKSHGLVGDAFTEKKLAELDGTMAIGHVRYAATGERGIENAQPMTLRYSKGTLAIAHNGALIDMDKLRQKFESSGAIFHTTSDTEVIAYAIAQERLACGSVEEAVSRAFRHLKGAYSLVIMSPQKLIAARDPWGFRPLCIGRRGDSIIFASESCALDAVGAQFEREVEPGEIVVVFDGKVHSIRDNCAGTSSLCIFEYIYFARPDSYIAGQSVHEARIFAGMELAKEHPVEADVVIGVPDSGLSAAQGYSMQSGIPLGTGFIKNRYIGRTFIAPTQEARVKAVRIKLNPLRHDVEGKRVIMVDDSIVRGTTSSPTVKLLKDAGAREVHVRISSPEFISPCYFGTDIPDKNELISCKYSPDEIAKLLNADSLGFLSVKSLANIAPKANCAFCDACFTENYSVKPNKGD